MKDTTEMDINEMNSVSGGLQTPQQIQIERKKFQGIWEPRIRDAIAKKLTLEQFLAKCSAVGSTREGIIELWNRMLGG